MHAMTRPEECHASCLRSRFFGIVVAMYHREHGTPHFHATYGEYEVSVDIETHAVRGYLPSPARRLVLEWASRHRAELLENWRRALESKSLIPIRPLE